MKKILFFGDSITDMGRTRANNKGAVLLGMGYVILTAAKLKEKYPGQYEIVNKGCSGDTILDLWNRYKEDVINEKPDIVSILIGVNDVWHRIGNPNSRGSKIGKFISIFENLILELKEKLPNVRLILVEPFFTHGEATEYQNAFDKFEEVYKYARRIKNLAKKYNIPFVKLQKKISEGQNVYGTDCLIDGVHPNVVGASIISKEWLKVFEKMEK